MGIKVSEFGKTSKGKIAHIYTLVNGKGMALEVTDYGATMVSILAPDACRILVFDKGNES